MAKMPAFPTVVRVSSELTRIISDIHFGDRASRVVRLEQLQPLLEGVAHLVLNGDTLDTRPGPYPDQTRACLAAVREFFPRAVPETTFLTGNHDANLSDQHRLDLANGRVFVTHGDIVFDDIVPWSRDANAIRQLIAAELASTTPEQNDPLDHRLMIWRRVAHRIPQRLQSEKHGLKHTFSYLADTLWPPDRVFKIIRAWRLEPSLAAELARRYRPRAGFVVTGHLHRPLIRRKPGNVIVINTGSFCPPFGAYAVDVTGERLTVRRVERSGGEFRPGTTVAEFPLAGG